MSSKTNISASTLEPIKPTHENGGGFWRVLLFSMWLCCCLSAPLLPRQACAEGDLVIYTDSGLVNGWQNWSWDAAIDFASTDYVHAGSSSIKVGYVSAWAGFRLNNNPFCSTAYTSLSFWVNGGTQDGRNIRVQGHINNAQQQIVSLDNYIEGGSVAAGAWRKAIIPLADLGVANNCRMTGFWLQEGSGGAQTPFYVDDISLLGLPPPASVNLSIDASQVVRVVDDRVFAVNAAIWDAALNTPETIALLQAVDNRILRFPGGSAADSYHWQTNMSDGNNWQWASNFDAFANVARGSGAQAFITVNYGSGTPQEAAEWVRYANVTKGSGFKYWEIGNENYGPWERDIQDRPHDPYRYAQRAKDYIDQMKAVDPTIKIGVVAVEGEDAYANYTDHPATNPRTGIAHNGWTPVLLATLKSLNVTPDFLIYHRYAQEPGAESDAMLLQEAKGWQSTAVSFRQQLSDYLGMAGANVELVATENNSVSHNPGKQTTSLVGGLFLADSIGNIMQTEFNAMVWWSLRNGQETANNNSAGLYGWRTYGDYGILSATNELYPTYYAMKLMKGFARGGDQIVSATSDYDMLSVFAAKRSNGKLSLLVINKSPTNTQAATIKLTGFSPLANADVTSYGIPQDEAARTGSGDANLSSSGLGNAASSFTASFAPYSATLILLSSPTTQASLRSRLFITSQHGSGNLGSWPQAGGQSGLAAGDQICQTLADNAALGGTWKALLSTPGNDFRDRSTHNAKGYMQIDGTVVANSWDELFNPSCNMWQGKLNLTETGIIAADHLVVQTGTQCDGKVTTDNTVQCGTNTQCSGWTSDSNWCVKGGTWVERVGLHMGGSSGGRCGYYRDGYNWSDGALYCVEQGVASSFKLSVAKLGNGIGTVAPDIGALSNIGTSDYANGTVVLLTASADSGSVFAGWSGGGCAGTGTCAVTLDAAKNVTASFNLQTCSYTAVPVRQIFTPASATSSIEVTATPPDCAWSAASNDSWLTITSGSGGTGNGTVGFTVGFSTSLGPRIGFLVVGGQRVAITQQGTAGRLAYNGHEYQRVDTNQLFAQAESHCESLSGHLATIASADENAFVYNNFVKGNGPAGENYMRLGGSDAAQEGVWAWITGEAWSYSNWSPGTPNGGTTENYVYMANSGQWDDWLDTSYSTPSGTPSICEWDSATTPVNGACGTASGQSFAAAPTTNLCASGTVSAIPTGPGPWSWVCNGSNGGTDSPLCLASVTQSITITTPAPASAAFNSQFTVAATASSGLPVVYSSGDPAVCTHDGAIFTLVAPTGSCMVRYDQPGNGSFSAAPQLTSDTIALKADQTIGVISLNPATLAVGGTATVAATGGLSGNPVTFSSTTTGVCTVSGSTVTGVSAGSCSIAADQAGDANYYAANEVTQSFSVSPVSVSPVPTTPTTQNVGSNIATLVLQSNASGIGYFTMLSGNGTACGTASQIKAGQDANGKTAPYHGSLKLVANTNGLYTVRNLWQNNAYTVCFTAGDANGNILAAPVSAILNTTAATSLSNGAWANLGALPLASRVDYTSLAFAPDGTPYLAYTNNGNKLTVQKYSGGVWSVVGTPEFSAGFAGDISLAFAPDGSPTVAYQDYGNSSKATVMQFNGSTWVPLGNAGFSIGQAQYTSLAFAPNGSPTVAYMDGGNNNNATVMQFNGSNWVSVGNPGFGGGRALYTSLAFAPDGSPTVAYFGGGGTVMQFNGSTWGYVGNAGFAEGNSSVCGTLFNSLAFAPDGSPTVAYVTNCGVKAMVMQFNGSAWGYVGSGELSGASAYNTSLAFAPDGNPTVAYVAYMDGANNFSATVMQFNGSAWGPLGNAGFAGGGPGTLRWPSLRTASPGWGLLITTTAPSWCNWCRKLPPPPQ